MATLHAIRVVVVVGQLFRKTMCRQKNKVQPSKCEVLIGFFKQLMNRAASYVGLSLMVLLTCESPHFFKRQISQKYMERKHTHTVSNWLNKTDAEMNMKDKIHCIIN